MKTGSIVIGTRGAALVGVALSFALGGCVGGGEDPGGGGMAVELHQPHGPRIIFEPLTLPVPDVPFPNDLTLRAVDTNPLGRAWNIAEAQPSLHRTFVRENLNKVDGFGPYAPIFVSFDGPLDLDTVGDATVIVINIEPGHPREGERAVLDLGRGYFPLNMRQGAFFGQDPFEAAPDMVFPLINDMEIGGVSRRVDHYEVETHTLIIRPVMPLAQRARHAVLITRGVRGFTAEGEGPAPVRSPFPYKAHAAQRPLVERAVSLAGLTPDLLAFGWTFTTADVTTPMVNLRDGVNGKGPLARMAELVPATLGEVRDTGIEHDGDGDRFPLDPQDHRFILQAGFIAQIMNLVAQIQDDDTYRLTFEHVDYLVFGSFPSPDIRTGPHKVVGVDRWSGEGELGVLQVPYLITVPQTTERHKPPFPVMFYFHGTGTSRMEALAIADVMGRQGIAVAAIDEVGHGPLIPDIPTLLRENNSAIPAELVSRIAPLLAGLLVPHRATEFRDLPLEEALEKFYEIGLFAELAVHGRQEDVNGDGRFDLAEGFFFADPFRQCATITQDIVDFAQFVRILRGLRQDRVPGAIASPSEASPETLYPSLMAGDFNADGILDVGGPDVPFSVAGTSLGGFHAAIAGAVEPEVTTASPIVAGGGLVDIMLRSSLRMITERLFLDVLGTVVVGCLNAEDGKIYVTQGNEADGCRRPDRYMELAFAEWPALAPGTPVTLFNEENGEAVTTHVNEFGGFSVAVETDREDALRLRAEPEGGAAVEATTRAKFEGSGYQRNTPDFRRAVGIQQHVFDLCDPINFGRHLAWEPLPGHPPTNVLYLNALGDTTVPVSTGVNLALASGVFGHTRREWEPRVRALIETGVQANGQNYDVDDILANNAWNKPSLGPAPPVASATGVSSIRFADVGGKHEWIAGFERDGFSWGKYSQHQIGIFHRCQGRVIYDDEPECLQDAACPTLDAVDEIPGCRPGSP